MPPTLELVSGRWMVWLHGDMAEDAPTVPQMFDSREAAFDPKRDSSLISTKPHPRTVQDVYTKYIEDCLEEYLVRRLA